MTFQLTLTPAKRPTPANHEFVGLRMGLGLATQALGAQQHLHAPVLGSADPIWLETWQCADAPQQGCTEGVHWRRSGALLYGTLELDEADFAATSARTPLQAASETAYRRIFALLQSQGLPHLWRVWNYVADINGDSAGLERYRQFNIGRHDAFLACGQGGNDNVPAACALGVRQGPLSIAFLAGAVPAVPIENPRQVSAYHYPRDYGPRAPTFSRAALVQLSDAQEGLLVSGTASIVGHRTLHPGDVVEQCHESMRNIEAVLQVANQRVRCTPFELSELVYRVYVRHASDHAAVQAALAPWLGTAEAVYVQADICRSDLLVEIEATALRTLETAA
ncbi:MAG TPA: Rid family hydrolase [Macromonas sp.]|nr:Rid family hydrolase [Macromonas sp.]